VNVTSPLRIGALAACLALAACQTAPPVNRGSSGGRMDPTREHPTEHSATALRSQDLITATDAMAQDIASRLDVVNPESPPRIVVGTVENRTTMPHQNYEIFLVRLRALLQSSGARHGLEFIREREYIEAERDREYGIDAPTSGATYRSRADYVLTCTVYDMPAGMTNFYLFDFQLNQLRDAATGPDLGPGAMVWENSYEVKYGSRQ
jgi:hypothetical protein